MATKIRLMPDNWTYRDYYEFVQAFRTGKNDETFRLAKKLILSWDYDVDLQREDAIMRLKVGQSGEVIRTVFDVIGKYIENLDIKDIKVNFDAWDTEKFFQFDQWKRDGKFDKTEPLMKEVIFGWEKLETEYKDGELLSFTTAATAYHAITKAYEKVVSGKN